MLSANASVTHIVYLSNGKTVKNFILSYYANTVKYLCYRSRYNKLAYYNCTSYYLYDTSYIFTKISARSQRVNRFTILLTRVFITYSLCTIRSVKKILKLSSKALTTVFNISLKYQVSLLQAMFKHWLGSRSMICIVYRLLPFATSHESCPIICVSLLLLPLTVVDSNMNFATLKQRFDAHEFTFSEKFQMAKTAINIK